jgi:hypothetical protein
MMEQLFQALARAVAAAPFDEREALHAALANWTCQVGGEKRLKEILRQHPLAAAAVEAIDDGLRETFIAKEVETQTN